MKNIVLIPDKYYGGNASGAGVSNVMIRLLVELGCCVHVYDTNVKELIKENANVIIHPRPVYSPIRNFNDNFFRVHFEKLLDEISPHCIITNGSITNKPICYLEVAKERGIKMTNMIFMQDFFCAKFYANDEYGVCTKCIDKCFSYSLIKKCLGKRPQDYIKGVVQVAIRRRLKKILPFSQFVISSSDEQLHWYNQLGVANDKLMKVFLFYDNSKLKEYNYEIGNYYVGIAQNRIEKGFHLLPPILDYLKPETKIILAYENKHQADMAIKKCGFQKYIDKGVLEIKKELSWNTGLGNLISKSRGVIIPSIWPTTTEYGLLEALGLHKPVFVFNVGIHKEIIENGVNGFSFLIGENKPFADCLSTFTDEAYYKVSEGAFKLFLKLTDEDLWKRQLATIIE